MAYRDLREFLGRLEAEGELRRVAVEVAPELEITEITDRICRSGGPALLFEKVKGSSMPVVTNTFGSYRRMALALGVETIEDVAGEIRRLLTPPKLSGLFDKLRAVAQLIELAKFPPKTVGSGACQEEILEPDLDLLPILKCWPGDAGRFITLGVTFTRDPDTGIQNAGLYRLQVFDRRTTGMHWHPHHDGAECYRRYRAAAKRMEVAVAFGGDPAITYAASAPMPYGFDEMLFAGFLRRKPVEMVKCRTVELFVPAEAEIVLEGYVEPGELRPEGPFGDHTGYYSPCDQYPVFHVSAMTARRNPIYPATVVGKPPKEDCYLGKATERIFLPFIQMQLPEIVDLNLPLFGIFHNFAFVSIRKRYPYQARKVMHALWGLGQLALTKFIIVVDEEVDVQSTEEVLWRVGSNVDPARDIEIVRGPLDVLDHATPTLGAGGKLGLDATRKFPEEGHPRGWPAEIAMPDEIKALVTRRWSDYGL